MKKKNMDEIIIKHRDGHVIKYKGFIETQTISEDNYKVFGRNPYSTMTLYVAPLVDYGKEDET